MEISKLQYAETLEKAAMDAANERVKQYNQIYKELSYDSADEMTKKYYLDFLQKLKAAYPYDKVTLDDLSAIKNYSSDKMQEYLYQFNAPNRQAPSPTDHVKAIKAADIFPLLQGVAKKDRDWMSMGNDELKEFGHKHEYNVKTKEGFAELLKDIGEQQINYDRAKIAQEAKDSLGWSYWPSKVITPSAMQEFENAIMTGGDYDAGTAAKMGAIDALTNAAMWEAPGLFIGKDAGAATKIMPEFIQRGLDKLPSVMTKPYGVNATDSDFLNGILNAVSQAGGEATRQILEAGLSDNGQSFDIAPVVFAGSAGATRPAIVGGIQQKASQFEGETAKQFSRGLARATRSGDPAAAERDNIVKKIYTYNNIVRKVQESENATKEYLKKHGIPAESVTSTSPSDVYALLAGANDIPDIAKLFGVKYTKGKPIDAKKILAEYDKPTVSTYKYDDAGKVVLTNRKTSRYGDAMQKTHPNYSAPDVVIDRRGEATSVGDPLSKKAASNGAGITHKGGYNQANTLYPDKFELNATTDPLYRSLFPQRYADVMAGTTRPYTLGVLTGKIASTIGGRSEPTFKIIGQKLGVDKTYKDEEWYQALPIRSKKIIDEAFKKKEEEETKEE